MLTLLPFNSVTGTRNERIKTFRFTLIDDTVVLKKLKVSIAAKDDKPRVNVFDDGTFTVGDEPTVYQSVKSADEEKTEWLTVFRFKAVHVLYDDEESSDDEVSDEV
jgi:hypothetical protein